MCLSSSTEGCQFFFIPCRKDSTVKGLSELFDKNIFFPNPICIAIYLITHILRNITS